MSHEPRVRAELTGPVPELFLWDVPAKLLSAAQATPVVVIGVKSATDHAAR